MSLHHTRDGYTFRADAAGLTAEPSHSLPSALRAIALPKLAKVPPRTPSGS